MRLFLIHMNQHGGITQLLVKEDWESLAQEEDICRTKRGEFKSGRNDVSIFKERVIGQEKKQVVHLWTAGVGKKDLHSF